MTEARAIRAVDIVHRWAARAPDRVCLTFYDAAREPDQATYGSLAREASRYAGLFRARGLRAGEPVVLVAHSVLPFVSSFLGAQEAGLTVVPCPPPERLEGGRRVRQRLLAILERCGARALFNPLGGLARTDDALAHLATDVPGSTVLSPDDLARDGDDADYGRSTDAWNPLAYCQFTSGSGGRAKGVLLSHENILANILAAAEILGTEGVAVSWLPLFHDMGLIGYVLRPLVLGFPCYLMTPFAFLSRPVAWLSLISRVRGTVSSAPNFAYGLCARKVSDAELEGLDLSSWRVAFNGAEPVTRPIVEAFVRRFAAVGFSPGAMCPAYGLAEDTLTATSRRPGDGARFEKLSREALERDGVARPAQNGEPSAEVASVGSPLHGHEITILDAEGSRIADRRLGEIAIRSASVMRGYWPGSEGEVVLRPDGWLLTGDLGYLADGELFIVGRKKDLIIRAGRNYYPEALEEPSAQVPGVRAGRVAAFAVPAPEGERVVVVAECQPDALAEAGQLRAAIEEAVFATVRFVPDDIVLLQPHTIPLTSSGKLMRPEAKRLYLECWRRDV